VVRAVWKERATTIPVAGEGIVLEGAWQTGQRGVAVVAAPHPEYGGSLDNPVVNDLAHAFFKEGLASLRFNWRGVGASQGRVTGDPSVGEVDYRAAVDHVAEAQAQAQPITAAGYSFGAAVAIRSALHDARLRRLVLVAPPERMLETLPLQKLGLPICVIVGGRDPFAPVDSLLESFDLPNARVDVIPEADHFFATCGLAELHELARAAVA
jgi:alpha/beta superfamily hydrolase